MARTLPFHLVSHVSRRRRTIIKTILYFWAASIILFLVLGHVFVRTSFTFPHGLWNSKKALLIVAHPDDEALFFNPTILAMTQRRHGEGHLGLVVVSSGNNYGLGSTRKAEIKNSCKALDIWHDHCDVLDIADLQDDPKKWWSRDGLQNIISSYVKKWEIDAIITFDKGGVSGHINHRAVSDAAAHYSLNTVSAPPTYVLSTTSVIRKYSILLDLPLSVLKHTLSRVFEKHGAERGLFVNSWSLYLQGINSFKAHASQFVWDRYLYIVLSRYMWFNDVRMAGPSDVLPSPPPSS